MQTSVGLGAEVCMCITQATPTNAMNVRACVRACTNMGQVSQVYVNAAIGQGNVYGASK